MDREPERNTRRAQRIRERVGQVPRTWTESAVEPAKPKGWFEITLDPDVDVSGAAFVALEARMAAADVKVHKKFSNRFSSGVVVSGPPAVIRAYKTTDDDIVDIISPVPEARYPADPWLHKQGSEEACTLSQAKHQIAIVDSVQGAGVVPRDRANKGQGAIVIVWDSPPESASWLAAPEYTDRPGGAPTMLLSGTAASPHKHGSKVASTCCGDAFGLASGAELGILPMSSSGFDAQVAAIDTVIQTEKKKPTALQKAIVLNMSFNMTFGDHHYRLDPEGCKRKTQGWTAALKILKEEYPRLAILNAAGNDGGDTCSATYGSESNACMGCYVWPTYAHGGPYAIGDEPLVRVGAMTALDALEPDAKRMRAKYSNHGDCVPVFTHGDLCAYDPSKGGYYTTQGTSFASPLFASMVALLMTRDRSLTGDSAIRLVSEQASNLPEEGRKAISVPPEWLSLETTTTPTPPGNTLGEAASLTKDGEESLSPPPYTSSEKQYNWIIVALCVVVFFGLFFWWYQSRKGE